MELSRIFYEQTLTCLHLRVDASFRTHFPFTISTERQLATSLISQALKGYSTTSPISQARKGNSATSLISQARKGNSATSLISQARKGNSATFLISIQARKCNSATSLISQALKGNSATSLVSSFIVRNLSYIQFYCLQPLLYPVLLSETWLHV